MTFRQNICIETVKINFILISRDLF